jgi:hypothetical protein
MEGLLAGLAAGTGGGSIDRVREGRGDRVDSGGQRSPTVTRFVHGRSLVLWTETTASWEDPESKPPDSEFRNENSLAFIKMGGLHFS